MTRAEEIIALAGEARDGTLIVAAIVLAPAAIVASLALALHWWLA